MGMTLLVIKDGATYDMTPLVENVTWSGRKSSAPRSLDFSLLDSDRYGHNRSGVDVERGQQCAFYWNGEELFRGVIMRQEQSQKRTATYKAYDNAIYLANNEDTFVYKQKTATQIFNDICRRFSLSGNAVNTGYVINDMTKPNTTCIDVIWAALAKTYRATGRRYYVISQKGVLNLIARADNLVQWVIEEGVNATGYSMTKSIENVRTRVKIYSDGNTELAMASDPALEARIGVLQKTESSSEKNDKAKAKTTAQSVLENLKKPEESFSIEALGIPYVYSGVAVWINVPFLGVSRTFYVDEDSHEFKMNVHTMKLTLNATNDVQGAENLEDDEK